MSNMNSMPLEPIRLPQLDLPQETTDSVMHQFADVRASEAFIEARAACAYDFLETYFLPTIKQGGVLTCDDLLIQTRRFRREFILESDTKYSDLDLLLSAQIKLLLVYALPLLASDLRDLVAAALHHLNQLLDTCVETLFE